MKNKIFLTFAALSMTGAILFAAGNTEQLVLDKCGSCHKVGKFCKHLGKKDAAQWTKVVENMIKKGAKINDEEKKTIATYLAGLKAGAKPICK